MLKRKSMERSTQIKWEREIRAKPEDAAMGMNEDW